MMPAAQRQLPCRQLNPPASACYLPCAAAACLSTSICCPIRLDVGHALSSAVLCTLPFLYANNLHGKQASEWYSAAASADIQSRGSKEKLGQRWMHRERVKRGNCRSQTSRGRGAGQGC